MAEFINTIDVMGDKELEKAIIENTVTEFKDNVIQEIGRAAFASCNKLTHVDCPNVTIVHQNAFQSCTELLELNMPLVTDFKEGGVFERCSKLEKITLPSWSTVNDKGPGNLFRYCYRLEYCDLPVLGSIPHGLFTDCFSLKAVVLRNNTLANVNSSNAFFQNCYHYTGTKHATYNPDSLKDGYVYVPRALVEDYKVATTWATLGADRFRAIEDYTVDGTITGELDESKI